MQIMTRDLKEVRRAAHWAIAAVWMLTMTSSAAIAQAQDIALPYRAGQGGQGDGADVTSSGLYSATVPMSLPSPRGDLGLPFAVTYSGGNRVGAAGLGWDIPILTVRRSTTLAQRKPRHPETGAALAATTLPAERLFLDLGSGSMLMTQTGPAHWRPMVAGSYIELEETDAGWTALDMSGRRYEFVYAQSVSDPASTPGLAKRLDDDSVWVLDRVIDKTGTNTLSLQYDVFRMTAPAPNTIAGDLTVNELVLRSVTHSPDASGLCPKYKISFDYRPFGATAPHPKFLALWSENGRMRTRTRILNRVQTWVQTNTDCNPATRALLNSYTFKYAPDHDTALPRLISVDLYGRDDDTTDPARAYPVRRYEYGSAVQQDALTYGATHSVVLDQGPSATLFEGISSIFWTGVFFFSPQGLVDLTGDARIDSVSYTEPGQFFLRANVADPMGGGTNTFPDATTHVWPNELVTTGTPGFSTSLANPSPSFTSIWRKYIDWNGDGRMDIVDAINGEDADHWAVSLNMPGPSGDPGDISWQMLSVDISHLRALVGQFHSLDSGLPIFPARPLPLSRSHTTYTRQGDEMLESGRVTEWLIADANADGFPDFQYHQMGTLAQTITQCDGAGSCPPRQVFDVFPTNALRVIYHTGLHMAGATGSDAVWRGPTHTLKTDGRCGLARFSWTATGVQHMACGALEFNGDGIIDYLIETQVAGEPSVRRLVIQSSGLPQDLDEALPENTAAWPFVELGRAVAIPGPVNEIETGRREVCPRDPNNGSLQVPGDTRFMTRQISMLRDLTGDGIADYVWFGTSDALLSGALVDIAGLIAPPMDGQTTDDGTLGWRVMVGSGRGFVAPRAIRTAPDASFEIHVSRERCDGQESHILNDLLDMDGDGRLDLVQRTSTGLQITSLTDATGAPGVHAAGKIVAERNGFGAATLIRYGSAKTGPASGGLLPYPQLVVTEIEHVIENGPGTGMAPTRYAYGDAQLHYDALLGSWVFGGYGRRVILEGLATEPSQSRLRGTATVVDARLADSLPAGLERQALTGSVHRISHLAGDFTADPQDLLAIDVDTDPRLRGQSHVRYGIKDALSPHADLSGECGDLHTSSVLGTATPDPDLCRKTALIYTAETTNWRGHEPWPSARSVATRSYVRAETVDDFGRIGTQVLENDRARSDDDICISTTFATPQAVGVRVLDAIDSTRVAACRGRKAVFDGRLTLYDGLPHGQVASGLVTGRIVERYDVTAGTLIETYLLDSMQHDVFGNVIESTQTRADGVSATQTYRFGPFGLTAERATMAASDVPVELSQTVIFDTVSNLPLSVTDETGLELRARYDHLGRLTRSSLVLPDDPVEYLQATRSYINDREPGPNGRGLKEQFFRTWTPIAEGLAAPMTSTRDTSVVETRFDPFGRVLFVKTELGADFDNAAMVEGVVTYDRLGRPVFAAGPHLEGTAAGIRYGTTMHYTVDGQIRCAILGTGPQSGAALSDPDTDRFAQCHEYDYANHRAIVRTRGPDALTPSAQQSGAMSQSEMTAIGRLVSLSRWQGTDRLELAEYDYNRLNALTHIRRYANPGARSGEVVWQVDTDSLGQVLRVIEPAASERRFIHDRWGNLVGMDWTDDSATPAVLRGLSHRFDGFGRLTQTDELADGVPDLARQVRYGYDTLTPAIAQAGAQHLIGRLSFAENATSRSYFGYDALGRRARDTRVHIGDERTVTTLVQQGPLGDLERLTFTDSAHPDDTQIDYRYDSAGHLTHVTHADVGGPHDLWHATQIDPFGRLLSVRHGNGMTTHQIFHTQGRKALREMAVMTDQGSQAWRRQIDGFDGQLRVKSETTDFGVGQTQQSYEYDALHRLTRALENEAGGSVKDRRYAYDGLGNIASVSGAAGAAGTLTYVPRQDDPDRLCAIVSPGPQSPGRPELIGPFPQIAALPDRGQTRMMTSTALDIGLAPTHMAPTNTPGPAISCSYFYDAVGNVRQIGQGSSATRLTYDAQARLMSIETGTTRLTQTHSPFGSIATRVISGAGPGLNRKERHFGPLVEEVIFHDDSGQPTGLGGPNGPRRLTDFRIPGVQGMVAHLRRLDDGALVTLYPHDDLTAARLTSDPDGDITQIQRYSPYGSRLGASLDSATLHQRIAKAWNGGDPLEPFGLVQLGARVYDPGLGRFLQRDPLLIPRGASRSHPYAFGWNDPVNNTDPLGLDPGCIGLECRGIGSGWGGASPGGIDISGLDWGPDIAWVQVSGPTDDGISANIARHSEWFDMARRYPCLACHSIRQLNRLPRNEEWDEGELLAMWSLNATMAMRFILSSSSLAGMAADLALGYFVFDEEVSATSLAALTPFRGLNKIGSGGVAGFRTATYARSGLKYRTYTGVGGRLESVIARISPNNLGKGGRTNASSVRFARRLGKATDDAGHGVAAGLGGALSRNLYSQDLRFNRGPVRVFEQFVTSKVRAGATVYVRVVPQYIGNRTRPFRILYQARINGRTVSRVFDNTGLWVLR